MAAINPPTLLIALLASDFQTHSLSCHQSRSTNQKTRQLAGDVSPRCIAVTNEREDRTYDNLLARQHLALVVDCILSDLQRAQAQM